MGRASRARRRADSSRNGRCPARRLPASWADGADVTRSASLVCAAAGVALGLGAEWVGFGWDEPRRSIPDLATGWSVHRRRARASARRPETRIGVLLIGDRVRVVRRQLRGRGLGLVAWIAAQVTYLYRGVLAHCVLAYPSGRSRPR